MRGMLIYEDRPPVAWWFKLLYFLPLLTLGLGFYFLYVNEIEGAATMFGITVFDAVLFRFITPRSFQIYTDRLVIKFDGPISKTIMLSDIKSVRPLDSKSAMMYSGMKFNTTTKNVLEIERLHGMNVTISPRDREMFIEQLNQTRKMYQS